MPIYIYNVIMNNRNMKIYKFFLILSILYNILFIILCIIVFYTHLIFMNGMKFPLGNYIDSHAVIRDHLRSPGQILKHLP